LCFIEGGLGLLIYKEKENRRKEKVPVEGGNPRSSVWLQVDKGLAILEMGSKSPPQAGSIHYGCQSWN